MRPDELPPKPSPLSQGAAQRIAAIIEAAEEAAAKVIDDAEQQARNYLEQAHARADRLVAERLRELTALADALVEQAEAVREHSGELLAAVAGESPPTAPQPARLTAVEPVGGGGDEPRAQGEQPQDGPQGSAGARLLATQLAVSGCSREEIERRLRSRFDIEDTDAILDAILGPKD